MGRLIDADKCPCIICDDTRNAHCTYEHRSCTKFCNWLNSTAYDVEKICEQLGEKAFDVNVKYTPIGNSYPISVVGLEKAIEIVCNGGKE